MDISKFIYKLKIHTISFFAGVPDSQLKALCDYLHTAEKNTNSHIITANEGNAVGLAAGYYMSTGNIPCIYMQNSGLGNIINPVTSLLNDNVYAIPALFIIGWRGEPDVHDEPQHIFQGAITLPLLKDLNIEYFILGKTTSETELEIALKNFDELFKAGKQAAIVVRKGALTYEQDVIYENTNSLKREDAIRCITASAGTDIVVSTTGKTSRELFEIREEREELHKYDFLTVGSMGHSSSIALGIALNKPNTKVWCIDGDGAAIMHMGAMAIIGAESPKNLIHIVINNSAHESVGGMPTVAGKISLTDIAKACGYVSVSSVYDLNGLQTALEKAKTLNVLTFVEVKAAIGSRADLGRPTTTPVENKEALMSYLKERM